MRVSPKLISVAPASVAATESGSTTVAPADADSMSSTPLAPVPPVPLLPVMEAERTLAPKIDDAAPDVKRFVSVVDS